MNNARTLAIDALVITEREKAYSNLVINDMLAKSGLDKRERALSSALYFGTLERKITLDYYISKLVNRQNGRIHCFTRQVLRTGIYQIAYMDKIPNSAAVNESVKIMKKSKRHGETGFVNAVLRKAAAGLPQLPPGDLSVKYSVPVWLVDRIVSQYGNVCAEKFFESALKTPPVTVRVNTLKTTREEVVNKLKEQIITVIDTRLPNALILQNYPGAENDALYKQGYYYFQDMASQICVESVGLKPGDSVLDVCAAPGGKTFTAAQCLNNTGRIVACDLYEHRVELIKKSLARLSVTCAECKVADATHADEYGEEFDAVLCDVPCSGIGVIGRKPDIKYKEQKEVDALPRLQAKILNSAAHCVKKGGKLVYSTCTVLDEENGKIVEAFLADNKDFSLKTPYKTYLPHIDATDGFFVAVMVRN